MSTDLVLTNINTAREYLAKVVDIQQAMHVMAMADAALAYGRHVDASVEVMNQAAKVRLHAERRMGEILKVTPKASGRPKKISSKPELISKRPTRADAGISKKLSSRALALAAISEEEFEEALDVPEGKELNHNRVAKEIKDKLKKEDRQKKRKAAAAAAPAMDKRIIVGDFREHADKIPDGSLSLIFTDPPYNREASKMLPDLAKFAAAKLAEGGSLICYVGHTQLLAAFDAFQPHLRYWWTIACVHSGRRTVMREYGINVGWKPVLWFVKVTRDDTKVMVNDTMSGGEEKSHHDWQQAQSEAEYWIKKLCPAGAIVCDPFLGGGTTAAAANAVGRQWIGFEIDEEQARIASGRLHHERQHSQ